MAAEIDPEVCYLAWSFTIAIVTDPACILLHYKGIPVEQIQIMLFSSRKLSSSTLSPCAHLRFTRHANLRNYW
jgi:hypothetical protein